MFFATLTAQPPDACPMRLRIDATNHIYENRMQAEFRVSDKTLISDLEGGCKESGKVSSITLIYSPQASPSTVKRILALIHAHHPAGISITVKE